MATEIPVTHEALSTMLGVRRSGITVATAALQKAGLIHTSRGRVTILDRPGLQALADRLASGGPSSPPAADAAADLPLNPNQETVPT